MPIYEYRCTECGERFEKLVTSVRATPELHCPKCGSSKVSKLLSLFSAKGSATRSSAGASCAPTGGG
jgi:putative FmdB family regulatory protein